MPKDRRIHKDWDIGTKHYCTAEKINELAYGGLLSGEYVEWNKANYR